MTTYIQKFTAIGEANQSTLNSYERHIASLKQDEEDLGLDEGEKMELAIFEELYAAKKVVNEHDIKEMILASHPDSFAVKSYKAVKSTLNF